MISRSSAKTQANQTSTTSVQNLNLEGTEGVTLAESSGNTITVSDSGAIEAGRDIAIDLGSAALDVGIEALTMGERTVDRSLEFAGRITDTAFNTVSDIGDTAITEIARSNERSLDFAQDIFTESLGAQAKLAGSNIDGLTKLARDTSENADDKVTQVAMYAFLAMAAVFVLPALFGRRP